MTKKFLHTLIASSCIFLISLGSPVMSISPAGEGTRINPVGIITSLDDDGIFTIEGWDIKFRIFEIKLAENFPKSELIGQRVGCRSIYSKEQILEFGLPEDVIVVRCQFASLFLRGDIADALVNTSLAWRVCDEQGNYILGCPYEEK